MQDYTRNHNDGYDLFCGLDVDKNSIVLTIRDRQSILRSVKMPYDS